MVTVGSVGAVGILAFVSPTIEAFFIWQAGVGLVYAAIMRWAAWRVVGRAGNVRFNVDELKRIWRFSASMSGIALTAIIFTQLDKIILSRILGLDEFGRYILATVVVNGLYILITPLFNVIYPLFSALIVNNNTEKLTNMYRLGTCMLATVLFPIAMVLAVFAEDLVHMWTGNPEIASSVAPIIAFLTIGSALHGVMYFPYALQLAYGQTRIPLMINAILMVVLVPLVISLALVYGALGGAIAWFVLQVLYVMLGTPMTHHRLLKGLGSRWLLQDVGVPLVLSLLAGLVGYYTLQGAQHSSSVRLMCGVVLALLASLFSLLASPKLRKVVLNNFGLKKQSEALFRRYD
jgi:O-antigen/teichoic acid export membrane protein